MWRPYLGIAILAATIGFSGCESRQSGEETRRDANTPAGKVGQAAHKAVVNVDKAGRELGRKLDGVAHDMHEGWKEDSRKSQDKK
jgi:hypothetical protein